MRFNDTMFIFSSKPTAATEHSINYMKPIFWQVRTLSCTRKHFQQTACSIILLTVCHFSSSCHQQPSAAKLSMFKQLQFNQGSTNFKVYIRMNKITDMLNTVMSSLHCC